MVETPELPLGKLVTEETVALEIIFHPYHVAEQMDDDVARKVKLANLDHNSDENRAAGCGLTQEELEAWKEKYARAKALLL